MPVPAARPITLYFPRAGERAADALAAFIRQSTGRIRLAAYALNHPTIVAAIADVADHAQLLTDHIQSFGAAQTAALRQLQEAGVPIRRNAHAGVMHLKMAVRQDDGMVTTGSFNWTTAAERVNDEVLAILADEDAAEQAAALFDCLWEDAARFVDWHPPTAEERKAMLLASPELVQMPEF